MIVKVKLNDKMITPNEFFIAGYNVELESYKEVPIISQKEKIKVDVLNKIGGFNDWRRKKNG